MKYITNNKWQDFEINEKNIYMAIDFDKTITTFESEDSWSISGSLLGEGFKKDERVLYNKYRPIETNYTMPINQKEDLIKEWYEKTLDLYYKYNLDEGKLKKSVDNGEIFLRKGVKEFMQKAAKNNIPIVILSAGIGNVIEEFLKKEEIYFDNIYIISNFLSFDKQGKIQKFDAKNIIHSLSKTMKGRLPKEIEQKIKDRPYKILIGDLVEDKMMIEKEEWSSTIKIAILEEDVQERLEIYKKEFDIVLTGNDATFQEFLIKD